jgi:hypothetical protein
MSKVSPSGDAGDRSLALRVHDPHPVIAPGAMAGAGAARDVVSSDLSVAMTDDEVAARGRSLSLHVVLCT